MAARESLTACILEMAEAETNPVLEILDFREPLVENKKYPPELLQFNQLGWRSYYHCHPASRAGNHRFEGEHGHFHIFVRTQNDPEKWSHLVALSMNNMGQPLGWFTVNHWVTGETWVDVDMLCKYLKIIPYDNPGLNKIVERWLLSLLAISRDKVEIVLYERDKVLLQEQQANKEIDIKKNKDIYLLSEIPINLIKLLEENQDKI
ncbi:MAG: hypothetical protein QM484_04765 [Woeseiaceae bacterium]